MPDELNADGLSFGTESDASPAPEPEQEQPYSSQFFNGQEFLTKVPDSDRSIVQKYLAPVMQEWDAGLATKFQQHKEQLKQWEGYDPEEIQRALPFYQGWNTDPEGTMRTIFGAIAEYTGSPEAFAQYMYELTGIRQSDNGAKPMSNEYDFNDGDGQEPDPRDALIQQQGQQLQELYEQFNQFTQSQEEAADEAALDSVMKDLHNTHGEFDDTFVLTRLAQHGDPNLAIQEWNQTISKYSGGNSQTPRPQPPKVMGGQGGIPSGQVDPSKLNRVDRKNLVAQYLEASQGQ